MLGSWVQAILSEKVTGGSPGHGRAARAKGKDCGLAGAVSMEAEPALPGRSLLPWLPQGMASCRR